MGMSASQARLLTLTSRMSDLEYSAQSISNTKLRLADQTEDAATAYSDALDLQKLTVYDSDTDSYIEATARNLTSYQAISSMAPQRFLTNIGGQVLVSQEIADAYAIAGDPNNTSTVSYDLRHNYGYTSLEDCIDDKLGDYEGDDYDEWVTYYTNVWNGSEDFLYQLNPKYTTCPDPDPDADPPQTYDKSRSTYYTNLFIEMDQNGYVVVSDNQLNDPEWLYKNLDNGSLYIKTWDNDAGEDGLGDFEETSWRSGDTSLRTEDDDRALARAEAEYDSAMARLKSKETKLDLQLKQIDTEHTAIQTEIDSVKKVIDKNIERTFKIFDA